MKGLLIFLAVVVLICLIPLGCRVLISEGTVLRVFIGPFHMQILPKKDGKKPKKEKKPKQKKPKKPKKPKQPGEEKPKLKFKLSDLSYFMPMIRNALRAVGSLRRSVVLQKMKIHITYGAKDAAARGTNYGRAWAAIGMLIPPLESAFRIRKRDLQALFDPDAEGFSLEMDLQARLLLGQILWIGLYYGGSILIQLLRFLRAKKKARPAKQEAGKCEKAEDSEK